MQTIEQAQAISLKNILVATDFSATSKAALSYAVNLARRHASTIYLAHVIPPVPRSFIPLEPVPLDQDAERAQAKRDMQCLIADSGLAHVDHQVLLERGPTWDILEEWVRQKEIDLLVLGTHGRSGISKLVLGSVAEELFRLASCPVLTVGPAVPADGDNGARMHEILFATDFGTASLSALPHAIALAKEDNAKLILLHVMSSMPAVDAGPYWYSRTDLLEQREPGRRKALEKLASLVPADVGLPFAPECEAPFDFLPQGILTVASERHADLIVMGVKHAAFRWSSTHMPWTLAHQVVCHAKCPVLTVRN
jgi:nucleotide-binding universal stress UspA family protein